ncbi:hypothetical protein [Mesorhizobium sp. 43Arga]
MKLYQPDWEPDAYDERIGGRPFLLPVLLPCLCRFFSVAVESLYFLPFIVGLVAPATCLNVCCSCSDTMNVDALGP